MKGRRNPFVSPEGIPFVVAAAAALAVSFLYVGTLPAVAAALLLVVFGLLFRDPRRRIPASPLGVVSPVDGRIVSVSETDAGVLPGVARVIRIRIDGLGTYTARSPVEGKVMDLAAAGAAATPGIRALWLQTDEGDDVVLKFTGYRFGLAPKSLLGFGERVGQGQRCAYLRWTRFAEVQLPATSRVMVEPGQPVIAGSELVGKLPHA